ncbi:MAG: putative beta-lysine N-acetyltransferase [Bacteroidales bacterium]|nr:putative beta-lysine N-acetyltransferase [Bacteroidales bacterium]
MTDRVIKTDKGSVLQHGKFNDRIYLMKLGEKDVPAIISEMDELARNNEYGKIFARIPLWALPLFKAGGYISEAYIPGYIRGMEDIHFVSKFLSSDRLLGIETDMLEQFSSLLNKGYVADKQIPEDSGGIDAIGEEDAEEAAALFRQVFETYPFPIHDPQFIIRSMRDNTKYFGIRDKNNKFIAISSAEVDTENLCAEMTDFAVLKSQRGKKLSIRLLQEMEKHMKKIDIKTLYTIARLNSLPMNRTFLRQGYKYTGTLIKNTNISGRIESMNILYKSLK